MEWFPYMPVSSEEKRKPVEGKEREEVVINQDYLKDHPYQPVTVTE